MGLWENEIWASFSHVDKRKQFLQVLPDEPTRNVNDVTHWVLFHYGRKNKMYVYDSFNRKRVTQFYFIKHYSLFFIQRINV